MRGLPGFDPLENADAAGLPRQLEGLAVDSVKSENVHVRNLNGPSLFALRKGHRLLSCTSVC